jgi:hypothetical protein
VKHQARCRVLPLRRVHFRIAGSSVCMSTAPSFASRWSSISVTASLRTASLSGYPCSSPSCCCQWRESKCPVKHQARCQVKVLRRVLFLVRERWSQLCDEWVARHRSTKFVAGCYHFAKCCLLVHSRAFARARVPGQRRVDRRVELQQRRELDYSAANLAPLRGWC